MAVMQYVQNKRLKSGINSGNSLRVESALRHGADPEKGIWYKPSRSTESSLSFAILKGHVGIAAAIQRIGNLEDSYVAAIALVRALEAGKIKVIDMKPFIKGYYVTIGSTDKNDAATVNIPVDFIRDSPIGYRIRELAAGDKFKDSKR